MESLDFDFEFSWEPFTFLDKHLTFEEYRQVRLNKADSSHWDAAIYKWEGLITQGEHAGKVGILTGETEDLRQRIRQYVSGTQEAGNKYWRKEFLSKGDVRLYILHFIRGKICSSGALLGNIEAKHLVSNNLRLVVEQLLVMREIAENGENRWIVNRKL